MFRYCVFIIFGIFFAFFLLPFYFCFMYTRHF